MSDHEMDESLVSAYFDGELNAIDSARAELLIETSAKARAEWQGYRVLSNLLHETNHRSIQANLVGDVMQAILNQEVASSPRRSWPSVGRHAAAMTNSVQVEVNPSRETRPATGSGPSGLKAPWIAVAASAACIVTMFWWGANSPLGNQGENNRSVAKSGGRSTRRIGQEIAVASVSVPATETSKAAVGANPSTQVDVKPIDPTVTHEVAVKTSNGAPGVRVEATSPAVPTSLNPEQLPVELIADLKNSNVGHIQRYLQKNQDGVTVFHLMVVDLKPGLESLEMILSAQQISGVDGKPVSDRSDVVAVYVEAKQDKMEALVSQIKRDHEKFLALAVQDQAMPTAQVASLTSRKTATEQAVPVNAGELKNVGVSPLQPMQIEMARSKRNGRSTLRQPPKALANSQQGSVKQDSPTYKVLIVVEKATPQSLQNTSH